MANGKAVVFAGGLGPEEQRVRNIIHGAEITVAADSGWDLAVSMGVVPDYYIGDMDSVSDHEGLGALPEERRLIYPVDKDFTDTELSIKFLEDKNYRDIVLIGGGGGRIDHLLAITSLFSRKNGLSEWYTADERIVYSDNESIHHCKKEQTLSLFSCFGNETIVSSTGLKWELDNFRLDKNSYSLSNTAVDEKIGLHVHKGAVLIMFNYFSL